jgi:hypothetical protein
MTFKKIKLLKAILFNQNIICFLILLSCSNIYAQSLLWPVKQSTGEVRMCDFSTPTPTVGPLIPGFGIGAEEEVNVMTDAANNLLFVTACNGNNIIQVRDRNLNIMPNGLVRGGFSSFESAICKVPCTSDQYYFFNYKATAQSDSLFYSVIDMSQNGGLGDVVQHNIFLGSGFTEGITISHQMTNGCRWMFVPGHDSNNNLLLNRFLISHNGISGPVIVDSYHMIFPINVPREVELSADNQKIVMSAFSTSPSDSDIILFDFDLNSGAVSNRRLINVSTQWVLGVEFSSNGSMIYYQTNSSGSSTLGRVNLITNANEIIDNNRGPYLTDPEMAGNGKIYIGWNSTNGYLSEIADPNNPNVANIQYTINAVLINPSGGCRPGFPNVIDGEPPGTFIVPSSINFSAIHTGNCGEYTFMDSTCLGTWWEWNFGDGSMSNLEFPIHNYQAGVYDVTLSVLICSDTLTLTKPSYIQAANNLSVSANSTNAGCGGALGSAFATGSGGAGALHYSWNTTPVQNTQDATGLSPGTYTVTVTDVNGCTTSTSVSINSVPAVLFTIQSIDAHCLNNDGSVTVNHSGGSGPFSYYWSSSSDTNLSTLTGLPAGYYSVVANDLSTGCSMTLSAIVGSHASFNLTFINVSNTTCSNGEDGSASVLVSGGQPPYLYLWQDGETIPTNNHLESGLQVVRVEDYNGCPVYDTISIGYDFNAPMINLGLDTSPCVGTPFTIYAGNGYSHYLWSDNTTGQSLTVNSSGSYSVLVTDSNGCEASDLVHVTYVTCNNSVILQTVNYDATDFAIYPNPVHNVLHVLTRDNDISNYTLKLTNIVGEEILSGRMNTKEHNFTNAIDFQNYVPGVYFLNLICNEKSYLYKVIKE